mmetsp:Transcript_19832/g.34127  ORF Transcript_19832/g.34127 Transcript_19832/m.34127 type:complete len:129 (-) Transcript_19832:400-786(-)|eukprot:CAMPEP_0196652674 /NCGR_PEP_ID=MMETSP1086-20130531/2024_1 /TAXON_ID=77921 /ORGANISM="Cyanoptyche  gloeocystis , Strain SAG4.97" /LENGTH=128 /DNA_ID=CAMNT_0041983341 /DNA_START=99 /DNA_END=485 /DNA_ORIENTATION=-
MTVVCFACIANAGRSQMAAAFFNKHCGEGNRAVSAGSNPGKEVHPVVKDAMAEVGIDLNGKIPQKLTQELLKEVDVLVLMGCGESACPRANMKMVEWQVPDPKEKEMDEVRKIRDYVEGLVKGLLQEL